MFSLYINIDHLKLLKKSFSIKEEIIYKDIKNCINSWGGVINEYSFYISSFPSNYVHSRINLLRCLQEINLLLLENPDIVGYSIIIDSGEMVSEIEYNETKDSLLLKTKILNSVWLTESANSLLGSFIESKKFKGLYRLSNSSLNKQFPADEVDKKFINTEVQNNLNKMQNTICYIDMDISASLYKNIVLWSDEKAYDQVLMFDLRAGGDSLISFINYLVSFNNIFNPVEDLDLKEKDVWGDYLNLYYNITIECDDYFVLDDSDVHFNKLIMLWFESFTKRFKTLLIVNSYKNRELDQLWQIISLVNNINIFIIGKNIQNVYDCLDLPELPGLSTCLGESLFSLLKKVNDSSLMVLYITLISKGLILEKDILFILSKCGYNILELKEELNFFKRKGLLLGKSNLYSGSERTISIINELKGDIVDIWKEDFLESLYKLNINCSFSYHYIYCIMSLNTKFHDLGLKSLFYFIEKELDLGNAIKIPPELIKYSTKDSSIDKILKYKRCREDRVVNQQITHVESGDLELDDDYETALNYIEVLNLWSENCSDNLVKKCKDLFFIYQSKGDHLNETRVKILFSLALLGDGKVNEAVDYLELNTSYSLSINDTNSYIRSGCFLAVSQYIKGNFSGVLRVSEGLLNHSWIKLKSKWYIYLMFVRFRALIEIGKYNEALLLIEESIIIAKDSNYNDSLILLNNWKGRALYYSGEEGKAREILLGNGMNSEGSYFLAEIEYYSGNYSNALSLIKSARIENDDTTLFDENIKWRDGYFLVEEFFRRKERPSVLKQEIESFYYFMLLNNDITPDGVRGLKDIVFSIDNDSLGVHDYRYIYYLYLGTENKDLQLDFNRDNLLNKVFKLLQQRTSQMDAHNQKHLYLNNFQNKEIIEAARSKKLF